MAESDPITNQNESEEDQADLETEGQIGIAPANNNFSISDLRRPLQKPLKGQEKPVEQVAKKDISRVAGTNMASGMPAGGSIVSRAAQAGQGLKNAFQAGFRSSRNPKPEQDQGANQKQTKDKKTSDLKIAKDATKAAVQAATGNYVGAVLNGLKSAYALTKKHPKEIALGCALPIAVVVVVPTAIFILGLLNMMPGSKSGTTFSQSQISYNSLNQIRLAAEGQQRTEALIKQIQEGNSQKLTQDLQALAKDAEAADSLKEEELGRLQSLVNDSVQGLTELASMAAPTDPTEPSSDFYKKVETVAENIAQIVMIYEKTVYGQPGDSGFYQLPELVSYVRKPGKENRQWGQKIFLEMLSVSGQKFNEKNPNYKIMIGDISCKDGGYMSPEGDCAGGRTSRDAVLFGLLKNLSKEERKKLPRITSHKCGLEADIYVTPKDKAIIDSLFIVKNDHNPPEGQKMVADLADIFFSLGVDRIDYASLDSPKFTQKLGDHTTHMHIRMKGGWDYPDCLKSEFNPFPQL